MTQVWRSALLALLAWAVSASFAAEKKSGVQITEAEGKLRITINGELFSEYHYKDVSRPYLYPLIGPKELPMTRNWPMAEAPNEEHDHPHHRSWWHAHGEVNGHDFWSESAKAGKTVHDGFIEVKSGEKEGIIRSRNKLVSKEGQTICTDERTLRIYSTGPHRVFDFEITTTASEGDLVFGDTKEGTTALRVAETMRLKGKVGKGHIVNSDGVRDGATWGKRAKWVDYHGPVKEQLVGAAIFDHPSNPRHPTYWHVRDYGLFAANAFGIHDFEKKEKGVGDLKLKNGEKVTFKYRFYLHEGDEKAGRVEEQYQAYVKEVK